MLHLRRVSWIVFASMLLCLSSASVAKADPVFFQAVLSGAQEVPSRATPGTGIGFVTLNGNSLSFNISFGGLLSPVIDAHIHCCAPVGVNAGVAIGFPSTGFPLNVTSGTYSNTFDLTNGAIYSGGFLGMFAGSPDPVAAARSALITALLNGQTYLNIHTALPLGFPGGEIRGQVVVVPEPATMLLLGTGLAGLAFRVHKRRKSKE